MLFLTRNAYNYPAQVTSQFIENHVSINGTTWKKMWTWEFENHKNR